MLIRALIVLLAVLNLGVAAWWLSRPAVPPPEPPVQPQGVARLELLAEAPVAPATAQAETPAPPPEPTPVTDAAPAPATPIPAPEQTAQLPPATPPQCFSLGPYADADAARQAITTLTGARGKAREARGSSSGNYSVYLPPSASRDEAQALAKRIGEAGFSDFLITRDGDLANGIALGMYRNPEGAQRRQAALQAAGFPAQIREPATSAPSQWWADITAPPGQSAAQARTKTGATQSRPLDCAALR
ncbi:MAG: SPOR domain-containing protein [Pseudoxanthomonas sp.]